MSAARDLDVVLFGATGYVGRLTAKYLAATAPDGVRIALAGRSQERLRDVRSSLSPAARDWPLLSADVAEPRSLAQTAASTRVLVSTVGPYRRYGLPVVEACASAGTHYADLTGEVLFMREAIDRFDAAAAASGARIVCSCGVDSIPSDLGVLLLHERASADGAGQLEHTALAVRAWKGGFSGGTVASLAGALKEARADPGLARLLADPYALSPDRDSEPQLGPEPDLRGVRRDRELAMWVGPFVMGPINTRVVRRSNALMGWIYGPRFRYREVMGFGSGPLGPVRASAIAGFTDALTRGFSFAPTRAALTWMFPSPGKGPSERTRERGRFAMDIHARTSTGAHYVCRIAAQGDPGYKATSLILGQSALCLTLDAERLPPRAGVLTPATAMGTVLAERLKAAGQAIEVERAR